MTAFADFVVHEPGPLSGVAAAEGPTLLVDLRVAFGEQRRLALPATEGGVGDFADTCHRLGGEALVLELSYAVGAQVLSDGKPSRALAVGVLGFLREHQKRLRAESLDCLTALDRAARQAFEHDLTLAAVQLQPCKFGINTDDAGTAVVFENGPERERYFSLRKWLVTLDGLRREVRAWDFTIPRNASRARRQFQESVLGPYLDAMQQASDDFPGLRALTPKLVERLGNEFRRVVLAWGDESDTTTPLDRIVCDEVLAAYNNLQERQPAFRSDVFRAADDALSSARSLVDQYWTGPLAGAFGRRHPLWRHPFLVQAAIEQLGWGPGDHGYADAMDALAAADDAGSREQSEVAEVHRMLGWASLGLGAMVLIPVVGEFAIAATILVTMVQTWGDAREYLAAREARSALGGRADHYAVPEPDALGLLCNLLSLTADVALPCVGKLLTRPLLVPTRQVLSAASVLKTVELGQHSANLTAVMMSVNAMMVERELKRVGLLDPGGQ